MNSLKGQDYVENIYECHLAVKVSSTPLTSLFFFFLKEAVNMKRLSF